MPYFRGEPFEFVVHYVGGKIKRQGRGHSFWYLRMNSSIAVVPLNVRDVPFVFMDITSDYQNVTYQGQASYRFVNPELALETLNLAVNSYHRVPLSQDLEMLNQRVTNAINSAAGSEIQSRDLASVTRKFDEIAQAVRDRLAADPIISRYGIEIVSLVITSISPTPEVAKALEAEFREGLLRKADEATYARRAAAIEEERKIKEREMETERAVEARKKELIALASENQLKEALARGEAYAAENQKRLDQLQRELEMWKDVDAGRIAALGFKQLGEKGAGNITITTEVLSAMMQQRDV